MSHDFLTFLILQDLPAYQFYFYNLAFLGSGMIVCEVKSYHILIKYYQKYLKNKSFWCCWNNLHVHVYPREKEACLIVLNMNIHL